LRGVFAILHLQEVHSHTVPLPRAAAAATIEFSDDQRRVVRVLDDDRAFERRRPVEQRGDAARETNRGIRVRGVAPHYVVMARGDLCFASQNRLDLRAARSQFFNEVVGQLRAANQRVRTVDDEFA